MDLSFLIQNYAIHSYILSFFIAAFLGEAAIFILAMLSVSGFIPIWFVFLSAFIGTMITDIMWFEIGRRLKKTVKRWKKSNGTYHKITVALDKTYGNNYFYSMLISKFMYAIRTANNIYLGGKKKLSLIRFVLYNLFVVAVWATVIVFLGYLAGTGVAYVWEIFKNLQIVLAVLFIFVVLFLILKNKVRKMFHKLV